MICSQTHLPRRTKLQLKAPWEITCVATMCGDERSDMHMHVHTLKQDTHIYTHISQNPSDALAYPVCVCLCMHACVCLCVRACVCVLSITLCVWAQPGHPGESQGVRLSYVLSAPPHTPPYESGRQGGGREDGALSVQIQGERGGGGEREDRKRGNW